MTDTSPWAAPNWAGRLLLSPLLSLAPRSNQLPQPGVEVGRAPMSVSFPRRRLVSIWGDRRGC